MIALGDPAKPAGGIAKEAAGERCLDPQLWYACAGGMVQMPPANSKVYYFLQGHAEHAQATDIAGFPILPPPLLLCRVSAVRFMADPDSDEVFARIRLLPLAADDQDDDDDAAAAALDGGNDSPAASFAKTLTQSDANNGGGFSVPRYCAETIFPKLDYNADPPVQTVLAKDVHGEVWKFRHIYRGTPRRHLLTTGWSTFVNQKKLVAGDSIVFLRTDDGDLCVGIRRAKRCIGGGPSSGWNHAPPPPPPMAYADLSSFLITKEEVMNGNGNAALGKVRMLQRAESVIEAAANAASGWAFEVLYYPRAGTPEFCVRASAVRAAMRVQWCAGMRFKMAFETEDSSRISWFMGTISSVQVADPVRWPTSPWRLLQVTWDEPDLLRDVKRVSPWLVELVSSMPAIHLAPFSPPRKKPRVHHPHQDFPGGLDGNLQAPPLLPAHPPLCHLPPVVVGGSTPSGSIQGARHSRFGSSLTDLQLNKLNSGVFHAGFHQMLDRVAPLPPRIFFGNPDVPDDDDDVSCLLTIGDTSPSRNDKDPKDGGNSPHLVLFGQPILTEEQLSSLRSSSRELVAASPVEDPRLALFGDGGAAELGLGTGHCKIFLESEDVGRTLDLSALCSYEELHSRLADMFGIERSEAMSRLPYRDSVGAVKRTGDEPFGEFARTARRLTISMDSSGSGSSIGR